MTNKPCTALAPLVSRALASATSIAATGLLLAAPAADAEQAPATESRALPAVVIYGERLSDNLALDVAAVSGSRLALTPRETPASVFIVDRESIEARGAFNTQEILSAVPGINAASPPGSAGSVSYRGFGASQLTQLFNGITVQYDAIAARPVDSWIYERVEVVGGPSTFLFGAGAVGGSINYITKLAQREASPLQLYASLGSYSAREAAFGVNVPVGDEGGWANHARLDASYSGSEGYVDGNERTAWTAAGSWLTDFGPRVAHTLALEYQNESVDRPYWGTPVLNPTVGELRIDEATRFRNYNSSDGTYEQTVVWVRSLLEVQLGDALAFRNTAYHYDALRDYRNVEVYRYTADNSQIARSASLLQRHDQTLTGDRMELRFERDLGGLSSEWAAGADFSVNEQTRFPRSLSATVSTVDPFHFTTESFFAIPGMVAGFVPDRRNEVTTVAVFLENRTKLSEALSLVTGLRHDRIELEVTNFRAATPSDPAFFSNTYRPTTGRVGLMYAFSPQANVYVQYSTAADPPAGILTTASFAQVRDFDLTRGRQLELGTKLDFLGGRGTATLAAYHIVRKNLAIADPDNPGTTLPVGQQSSRGVELAAALRATDRLRLSGNFAYVDAEYDDFFERVGGIAVSRAGMTPPNTPSRVANLWASYAFSPAWEAGIDGRHVASVYGNTANTRTAPDYTLWGAFATYHWSERTELTVRVRNATDEIYARSLTGTPMFFLGAPRTVELALRSALF